MNKFLLDLKLIFYKQAMKAAPDKFRVRYYRNYAKRYPSAFVKGVEKENPYSYDCHYEPEQDYSRLHTDVKAIAYYLPQFHTFPENDAWWGKDFTEWTNTRRATPRRSGHYQPRTPHADIGYYDLSDVSVMAKQAALAKRHGIYGFCMYYYWFSGKKLMEKPLDNLMARPEIDFPFCLCWANENWSRKWDGRESHILIAQKYKKEDPLLFIQDLVPYLKDKRYIRVNGKPIVLVYNIGHIPNPAETFEIWRKYCRENGVGEIEIWGVRAFMPSFSHTHGNLVDREVEFPPHLVCSSAMVEQKINAQEDLCLNYRSIVREVLNPCPVEAVPKTAKPIVRGCMLGWDNTARHRERHANIYDKFSLYIYYQWLRHLAEYTRRNNPANERFLFINAWNEWAEGTYLEPDEKYGYANINVTSRALLDLPFDPPVAADGVVIACLESMGDIVACEPVIGQVKKQYPDRPVYWATSAKYTELLRFHPDLAGVLPFYTMEQWIAFQNGLPKSVKVVDLHFRKRAYYLSDFKVFYNNNRADITDENYYLHGNSLLEIFSKVGGIPPSSAAPKFYLNPNGTKLDLPQKYVAFHTFSAEAERDWTERHWRELAAFFAKKHIPVVEVGTKGALEGEPGCLSLTKMHSLQETANVIAGASLFIGIDSGWAHVANALGVPGIILLGKYRAFERYMPYSGNYQQGINSKIIYAEPGRPAASISAAQVMKEAEKFIGAGKRLKTVLRGE